MLNEKDAVVKKTPATEDHVTTMIEKAAYTQDAGDAMKVRASSFECSERDYRIK